VKSLYGGAVLILVAVLGPSSSVSGQSGGDRLIVFGDTVLFYPPGHPRNCILNNQFKRGEPVGFRMTAINGATGTRDRKTQLVVHLSYAGDDAPMGIVRYTVSAKDPQGRTAEFKPFEVQASQITIVP
jgi:hypothetical protein